MPFLPSNLTEGISLTQHKYIKLLTSMEQLKGQKIIQVYLNILNIVQVVRP